MPEITRPQPGQWIRFRPDTFTMLLAALSALGVALVMAREITYGVALHWDSIQYIAGARNLLAGEGYSDIWGQPIEAWPPLYSLLLATASLGTWDPTRRCRPRQRRRLRADHIHGGTIPAAAPGVPLPGRMGLSCGHLVGSSGRSGFMGLIRVLVHPADHLGSRPDRPVSDRRQDLVSGLGGGVQRPGLADPEHGRGLAGARGAAAALPAGYAIDAAGRAHRRPSR